MFRNIQQIVDLQGMYLPLPQALRFSRKADESTKNWGRAREGSREGERREESTSFPWPFPSQGKGPGNEVGEEYRSVQGKAVYSPGHFQTWICGDVMRSGNMAAKARHTIQSLFRATSFPGSLLCLLWSLEERNWLRLVMRPPRIWVAKI